MLQTLCKEVVSGSGWCVHLWLVWCHYWNSGLYRVLGSLPSAALGKVLLSVTSSFNECRTLGTEIHSAKSNFFAEPSLPNRGHRNTQRRLRHPGAVTAAFLCPRQRRLCRCTVYRTLFAECDTQQSLCRVFFRLCRVLQTLGKAVDSGSVCAMVVDLEGSTPVYIGVVLLLCRCRLIKCSLPRLICHYACFWIFFPLHTCTLIPRAYSA
jgi:hypothetical protein